MERVVIIIIIKLKKIMSTQKCNVCKTSWVVMFGLILLLLPPSHLCLFSHSPSCPSLVVDPTSHSFPICKNSTPLPSLHTFSFTFSLGPSFLFLSQRLQQESHGRPLQADALQLVLHFVLEISEPDWRVDQNRCKGWKEIGRSSQSNSCTSQSKFSRATQN